MMNDLVERLLNRDEAVKDRGGDMLYRGDGDPLVREAATEIERLRSLILNMRNRAGNLATLLESAATDARNIQMPGLFSSLTPEQQKAALEYDGPENHGDPNFRKRTDGPGNARTEVLPAQDAIRD